MDRQIRRLAIAFLVLFGAIAVNLNYIQVVAADRIANNNANRRLLIQEYEVDRGDIVAADHRTVLAESEVTGGDLKYQRRYPEDPDLGYGHLTGYHSFIFGRTELEQSYNSYLSARADELFPQQLPPSIHPRPATSRAHTRPSASPSSTAAKSARSPVSAPHSRTSSAQEGPGSPHYGVEA
jgi:penicillin-binding protein A